MSLCSRLPQPERLFHASLDSTLQNVGRTYTQNGRTPRYQSLSQRRIFNESRHHSFLLWNDYNNLHPESLHHDSCHRILNRIQTSLSSLPFDQLRHDRNHDTSKDEPIQSLRSSERSCSYNRNASCTSTPPSSKILLHSLSLLDREARQARDIFV